MNIINKKLYYILITISFLLIAVPEMIAIVFHTKILGDYIDGTLLKTILVFFISFMEASYIKQTIGKIFGWAFSVLLFVGILFKLMHWVWGTELIMGAGFGILINLLIFAVREKTKNVLHYLLFAFVLERLIIIMTAPNEVLWWIDVVLCALIAAVGVGYTLNLKNIKTQI